MFSLRDGKDESSYSGQTFTVSVILDGDKSTYQTGKGKGFGTASIDINDVIYKYDAVDIKSAKFVYFKVGEWVFKIDFDGFDEAVVKALTFVEEEEDPFGGVSSDPFDTPKKNITNSVEWTEAYDLTSLNPFELSAYLDVFVKDAAAFGIDLSYVYDGSVSFEFKNDPVAGPETIAYTDSLGKDDKVHVVVNPYWWNQASPAKRLAIMYHELGHDILNFDHDSDEGPLMSVYAQSDYTYEDLFALRAQMFTDYLNGVEYGIEDTHNFTEAKTVSATIIIWGAGEIQADVTFWENGDISVDKFSPHGYVVFFKSEGFTNHTFAKGFSLVWDKVNRINIVHEGTIVGRIFFP